MNELISNVTFAISVISLIVFFILASNVRKIKNSRTLKLKSDYYAAYAIGDLHAAHRAMLNLIMDELVNPNHTEESRRQRYEQLKKKYEATFQLIRQPFPGYPF